VLSLDPRHRADHPPENLEEELEEELVAALPDAQAASPLPHHRRGGLAWRLVALVLLAAAGYVLWREFHTIRLGQVLGAIRAWGLSAVAAAIGLSAISFVFMGLVEWLGLRWAGARLKLRSALAGSFIANAIAHSLGANLIVSGVVRARYYARHNVSLRQVAATTLFHGFSFGVGLSTLAGLSLLLAASRDIAATSRIANPVADGLGVALLAAVGTYVLLCATLRRPLRGFGHVVKLPSVRVALAQMTLGTLDNAVAASIIWILLPAGSVAWFAFVAGYAPSVVVGLVSHVPGGVGVFEGSLSTLMKGVPPAALAAAFLGYRLFFFLLPLGLAAVALALDTARVRARK
jgi:uncharacterized membrane protein YbhN (UPF0104 family)